MADVNEILKKYSTKLNSEIASSKEETSQNYSEEYLAFKSEMSPEISNYERWAKSLGNLISLKTSQKDSVKIQKQLDIAHADVTPSQAITLATISLIVVFFATLLFSISINLIMPSITLSNLAILIFLGLIASIFVFYYAYSMPQRLANAWRLRASAEMVPAILYMVVYMKHTSNLEKAIQFASQHLEGPLALDFKKIIYDVEIGKYSNVKHSLDVYLESWREYSPEFVESFHLIESSLYEPSDSRRIQILEKSLQIILEGIYEKMMKYSREIRSPLTNIYMLGIILPTLSLALLPLASTLLQGLIQWPHVFIIFNVLIPFFVFYMSSEVLLKRPGGYGESSVLELNPDYKTFTSKKPWFNAALICIPILLIGLVPFIFQIDFLTSALGISSDYTLGQLGLPFLQEQKIFDFRIANTGASVGPFSPIGVLFSLFIPLSLALFFAISYSQKTSLLIKSRNKTKLLEEEFTNSLFQLGNRLGDGIPAEIAFSKVAESTRGQATSSFFSLVNENIQQLGMSLERAIFDKRRGALIYYPSALISTSMRILVESVKKGLEVAARSLMSISEYVKNIEKINQRLRDLMAEIISDMKSNMVFLAPLLSGIVVGLSVMITVILTKLESIQNLIGAGDTGIGGFSFSSIMNIFQINTMIPPYFVQACVGIYIVEIIFILTSTLVTVDSGKDMLKEKYELSKNLKAGITLYLLAALASVIALTALSLIALGGLTA